MIKEDFQKRGIGTRLLSYVEKKAKQEGCRKIILETSDMHKNALSFYISNHYQIIKNLPKLYYGANWFILIKNL